MPGDNPTLLRGRVRPRELQSIATSSTFPQRSAAAAAMAAESPLTPSPFSQPNQQPRVLFPTSSTEPDEEDEDFDTATNAPFSLKLAEPFASPSRGKRPAVRAPPALRPRTRTHSRPLPIEDSDGGIFLSTPSKPTAPPTLPRPVLSPVIVNNHNTRALTSRKRKPSTPLVATPTITPRITTPLGTTSGSFTFDRLAPLPAPKFITRTPPSKPADTEAFVHAQTRTMTKLRIVDRDVSSHMSDDEDETAVIAAVSAEGHVTKRRARTRPVSSDLQPCGSPQRLVFPTASPPGAPRSPRSPGSPGSSEFGSPQPRRRVSTDRSRSRSRAYSNGPRLRIPPTSLARLPSESSATTFFGPAIPSVATNAQPSHPIPQGQPARPVIRARHSYSNSQGKVPWANSLLPTHPSSPSNAEDLEEDMFFSSGPPSGPSTSGPTETTFGFAMSDSPSPRRNTVGERKRGLPKKYKPRDSGICLSEEESNFLARAGDASFSSSSAMPSASTSVSTVQSNFSELGGLVTPMLGPGEHTGWPAALIAGSDDMAGVEGAGPDIDAFIMRTLAAGAKDSGNAQPTAPGGKKAPGTPVKKMKTTFMTARPWQSAVQIGKIGLPFIGSGPSESETGDDGKRGKKKPRASMPMFPELGKTVKGKRKLPGLSLVGKSSRVVEQDTDEESIKEWSPSTNRQRFSGIGLGRPTSGVASRARWIMRRNSSGQFDSGNESAGSTAGTPTRAKGHGGWPSQRLSQFSISPSKATFPIRGAFSRTDSNSSVGTAILNSPTVTRRVPPISNPRPLRARQNSGELLGEYVNVPSFRLPPNRASTASTSGATTPQLTGSPSSAVSSAAATPVPRTRMSSMSGQDHRAGWFERAFTEIDDLGSGEFGKVMKVRRNADGEVYAVKKSRQFEGGRQRLRLREEVDVLQHLSRAMTHPNVLGYIDSWEQDEQLYIQTELCEHGNFARFLWEFGRAFPKLDEARVWKIFADLSHGLRFIHENGIIHLDLKPANIFVTADGRFKIGDFGMATPWPRPLSADRQSFEREGDKVYLAAEVLQGQYGPAADVFSLGMIMLETASNIVVPDQGEPWHRLRREDFADVDLDASPELFDLIRGMMRTDPARRLPIADVHAHPVVARARAAMERQERVLRARGESVFPASPLGRVEDGFLAEVLARSLNVFTVAPMVAADAAEDEFAMDLS